MGRMIRCWAMVLSVLAAAVAWPGGRAVAQEYIMATASTGGTYYPVGVAISTVVKVRLRPQTGINITAVSTAGSGENVQLLREQTAQFAIMSGLYGHYAVTGSGALAEEGVQSNMRSIMRLWPDVEHFVVRSHNATSGTLSDLERKRGEAVAIGMPGSGTLDANRIVLSNLGFNPDRDFRLRDLSYDDAAQALIAGDIEMMSVPAGVPVGAVNRAFVALGNRVRVLDITDDQLDRANAGVGIWTRYELPAGTYPGQDGPIRTMAQPNFLATDARVTDEHVYQVTKTIIENDFFLHNIHPATRAISLENALDGLRVPLHPGAVRYYEEKGISIPSHLLRGS